MSKNFIFSPSEFAFGLAGCKRCYYDLKVNNLKIYTGFPSIFSKFDTLQKKFYHNKSTAILKSNKISPGVIKTDFSKLIMSKDIEDNKGRNFKLRGKIDAYVKHKDSYSIIDFKVTNLDQRKVETYKTQLMSYVMMLENPFEESLKLYPIKNLGIFCFNPDELFEINDNPSFKMSTMYFNIERNDNFFLKFITEVIDFLEGDTPNFSENCSFCNLKKNKFS